MGAAAARARAMGAEHSSPRDSDEDEDDASNADAERRARAARAADETDRCMVWLSDAPQGRQRLFAIGDDVYAAWLDLKTATPHGARLEGVAPVGAAELVADASPAPPAGGAPALGAPMQGPGLHALVHAHILAGGRLHAIGETQKLTGATIRASAAPTGAEGAGQ